MENPLFWLVLVGIGGFLMAFANGANDVANAFASAVGAKALTVQQATLIAGLMNFLGAALLGGVVSAKLITGLINPSQFDQKIEYMAALFAVLLSSATFVLLASYGKMPVSSSHAIVGSLVGVSAFVGGWDSVRWEEVYKIIATWFSAPILAGLAALLILSLIRKVITQSGKPGLMSRLQFYLPYFLGVAMFAFALILMKKGPLADYRPSEPIGYIAFAAVLVPYGIIVSQGMLRAFTKEMPDAEQSQEDIFKRLQVGTSCYMSFAHGANDVANAIAPVFGIWLVYQSGQLPTDELIAASGGVPLWILVLGGCGIMAGIALLGYRVIETLSSKVTTITNTRGFCVDFSAASTVVGASMAGIPVSTTQVATGAIIGTGLADRERVNWRVLGKIFTSWVLTVPLAAGLAIAYFFVVDLLVG